MNIQIYSVLFISLLGLDLMAKRIAPKPVAPIQTDNAVYSVPHFSLGERSQNGGFIEAHHPKTKKLLWRTQIYKTDYDPDLEGDIQDVFIKTMSFDEEKNQLIVSDERSRVFLLNLSSKKVTQLKESAVEQFFDSLDRDKVKTLTLQWSKAVKNVAYSFNKDSFVTNKRDAELVFYFDRDDCSKGALIGHDDEEGFIFPVENKNLSEISLDKIPTNKSKTKVGFRPMTKDKEGLGFWVKTTSGRFVLAVIKKVEPQEFKNFDGGGRAKVELEWTWQNL